MTTWAAVEGEILDVPADALICSANPQLNLSGGVGGALSLRYGGAMQAFLQSRLAASGERFIKPSDVVVAGPCGSPFKIVVHAVAVDAFYETSADIIRRAYANAFQAVAESGCRTVAAACLACGYGRFPAASFAEAVAPLFSNAASEINWVTFVSRDAELVDQLQATITRSARELR